MPTTPPTSFRGVLDDSIAYGSVLSDFTDNIGDCLFPASTETYRLMRKHPQLAAVEKAYTLPIRRATWTLNPAGCRPEVVQLVADDLGLPVAGKDEPGSARVRGVTWAEHLRLALLSLPFGFSPFEMLAEVKGGQARLVELSERLPSTVSEFHTDKVGRLTGISQDMLARKATAGPQIRADRLVLYTREREGAAYWGNSILRPAFAAWYLSREMIKVAATSHRRFGMGVPVVRALPGTNPTVAQETAAAQLAQQARVGESAGASLPAGFVLELIGQQGGSPDTLAFLRYLDQAMARQALAGFIDLGTTETGSRALAGEFIDLFLLAIQSEALSVADLATRQIAARIVGWNFGEDEPVPAIQVADVGTKHDITAEALNLLLQSGALSADPGLEAQVRRMYRLPEREESGSAAPSGRIFEADIAQGMLTKNERRAMFNLPPVDGGDVLPDTNAAKPVAQPAEPAPVAAAAKRRPRKPPAGQLALPIAASAEEDARRVQAEWLAAVAAALTAWPVLAEPLVAELADAADDAVTSGDVAALAGLAASAAVVDTVAVDLAAQMAALASSAAGQVVAEAAAQGVTIEPVAPDGDRIGQVAAVTAALIGSAYAAAAARRALQAPADVAAAVTETLADMSTAERGTVADHIRVALSMAQGQGRLVVLAANPPTLLRASEVNDKSQCLPCKGVDGTEYSTLTAALADYPNGMQFRACEGQSKCRGMLLPIWT